MVYCPSCGSINKDDANFCNNCGSEIRYDGGGQPKIDYSEYGRNQTSQTPTRPSYQQPSFQSRPRVRDEADTIYYCCAFCFPIVGIVLWLVWREERPQTANTMLILGIISFILSFFLGLITG